MPNRGNKGRRRMGRAGNQGSASKLGNTLQAPLKVFLKLTWLDPTSKKDAPKKRPFPKDLPLTLTWGDGDPERVTVGDDGLVKFEMGPTNARARKTFLLTFAFRGAKRFILCEKEGDPEETKFGELPKADDKGVVPGRVFALPQRFTTQASDWKADDAHPDKDRFTPAKGSFALLSENKPKDIGTQDKPLVVTLDPHWQYLRVEFFDRYYGHSGHSHKPVTVPALMFEGHRYARLRPMDEHKAETESNWTLKKGDHEALVQCVPWILRKNLDSGHEGDEEKKPDRESLLLFRTKEKTFVKSTSATARALSVETGDLKLDADRLKLYDLPQLWMSRNQFAWLGESDEERGWFQDLAAKETTLDKPLCVSLDDIVLTWLDGGTEKPFVPAATDLPLLFYHTFEEATGGAGGRAGAAYSKEGIYKPGRTLAAGKALARASAKTDAIGKERHDKRRVGEDKKRTAARLKPATEEAKGSAEYSRRKEIMAEGTKEEKAILDAPDTTAANDAANNAETGFEAAAVFPFSDIKRPAHLPLWHIVDYPHWTRVLLCQGDLFDTFDQRTHQDVSKADDPAYVVGARAARRWYDRNNWVEPGNEVGTQPALVRHPSGSGAPSFALQVLYFQEYSHKLRPYNAHTMTNGRSDVALLRCCDVVNDKEVAANLHYLKFFLEKTPAAAAVVLHEYQNHLCGQVPARWIGTDGRNLSARPKFVSADDSETLTVRVAVAAQCIARPRSHFHITIEDVDRAWANGAFGTGALGPTQHSADEPVGNVNWFTAAHETGHFLSLPDDYGENVSNGSYRQLDFTENSPGLPFDLDGDAMMRSNRVPRARHFWFAAEWVRLQTRDLSHADGHALKIWHGGTYSGFKLPRHASAPKRSYASHPLARHDVAGPGTRQRCELFLYRLGEDATSKTVYPAYAGGGTYDGILVVVMRVKWTNYIKVAPPASPPPPPPPAPPPPPPPPPTWEIPHGSQDSQNHIDWFTPLLKASAEDYFNKRFFVTGDVTTAEGEAVKFSRCLLHFQPRLSVANYGLPATVRGYNADLTSEGLYTAHVESCEAGMGGPHASVFCLKRESAMMKSDWDDPAGTDFQLAWTIDPALLAGSTWDVDVKRNLRTMINGLAGLTTNPSTANLQDIVRLVIPNGTVHSI